MTQAAESAARKYAVLRPHLDERQRRLLLGAEAGALGRGGIKAVAGATGVHPDTIARGVAEAQGQPEPRVRAPGGGRKKLAETDPALAAGLKRLVDPETRGDPMSALVWTTKSTRHLAGALTAAGHVVSGRTVARMLAEQGFSLQGNAKVTEGRRHEDRDAQFRYLNDQVAAHVAAGQPVVSVDAKKKENVGDFENGGREYQPNGQPERVNVHDFMDKELGKALPYGIYDLPANAGWVSAGADHDTSAFAVATLRTWWDTIGKARYPRGEPAADLRRRRRVQRLPHPRVEDRARRPRRRDRPADHRLPPAAGHQQVEQDRAPAVLPDHPQLARTAAAHPPDHRRADQQHHHDHRANRLLRPGHRRLPDRHQVHQEAGRRPADHLPRLPRRMELLRQTLRHAVTIRSYFFALTE